MLNDFEIVIVSCVRDWELTVRCVESINTRFSDDLDLQRINIIWNEPRMHDDPREFKKMRKRIAHVSGRYPIRYLTEQDIDPRLGKLLPGSWYNQQYLKLKVSEKIDATWYLVLDSKDYWFKRVDTERLFHPDGRARLWVNTVQELKLRALLDQSRSLSPHLADLESELHFGYAWLCTRAMWQHHMEPRARDHVFTRCTTPYMFHTQTAQQMNQELEERLGGFYPFLFHTMVPDIVQPIVTEFHLYTNYVNSLGLVDTLYDTIHKRSGHSDDQVPWLALAKNRTLDGKNAELPPENNRHLRP